VHPRSILHALCLAAAGLLVGSGAAGDPLDKVTGTEGWEHAGPEDVEAEWKDWYRGRVELRRASREIRVQRVVSQRLAKLLEGSTEMSFEEIKRIIVAGTKGLPADPDTPAPAPASEPPPPPSKRPARPGPAPAADPAPEPEEPAPPAPRKPAKPSSADDGDWTKVPVERLDKDGQALDDEGDRVLKKAAEKKRKR
jgi:hypothetical protein